MNINWEMYRHADRRRIDCFAAYKDFYGDEPTEKAQDYLLGIEEMRPICSRQIAAVVVATMRTLK